MRGLMDEDFLLGALMGILAGVVASGLCWIGNVSAGASVLVGCLALAATWGVCLLLSARWRRPLAGAFVVFALVPVLASCTTTGGVTPPVINITPAAVQSFAYDVGYLGYRFTPEAQVVQPILAGVCAIDTTQDPAEIAAQLKKILSQVWSSVDQISSGDATAILLAINNLVGLLGLNADVSELNVSPYIISAIQGVCQGVQAAEAGVINAALIRAAKMGALPGASIPRLTLSAPPELVAPPLPLTQRASGIWDAIKGAASKLEFWKW